MLCKLTCDLHHSLLPIRLSLPFFTLHFAKLSLASKVSREGRPCLVGQCDWIWMCSKNPSPSSPRSEPCWSLSSSKPRTRMSVRSLFICWFSGVGKLRCVTVYWQVEDGSYFYLNFYVRISYGHKLHRELPITSVDFPSVRIFIHEMLLFYFQKLNFNVLFSYISIL